MSTLMVTSESQNEVIISLLRIFVLNENESAYEAILLSRSFDRFSLTSEAWLSMSDSSFADSMAYGQKNVTKLLPEHLTYYIVSNGSSFQVQ